MKKLETLVEDGTVDLMPNKEASRLRRELAKLQRNLDGLRHMERVPDLLYVIDPDVEQNAVHEANIMGIPIIAIVDTNCDPDPIDFPVPGNDDAIKATKLITARIADAVLEGREGRQDEPPAPAPVAEGEPEGEPAEEVAGAVAEEAGAEVEDEKVTAEAGAEAEEGPEEEIAKEEDDDTK